MVKSIITAAAILFSASTISYAVGSAAFGNLSGTSAKVTAHGYAFVGVADDPSAVFYNPAGLVNLDGWNIATGLSVIDFESEHSRVGTQTDKMDNNIEAAPYFYLTYTRPNSRWAYGLGINSPFGLSTKWKDDSFSKYHATESKLKMYSVNPSFAYRIDSKFSFGGGIDFFNVFDLELQQKIINLDSPLIPGSPTGDGDGTVSGDGIGWGYNLGALFKANDRHSFGLSYRSQVNVSIDGETKVSNLEDATAFAFGGASFRTETTSEVKFPQSILIGWGYKPSNKVTWFLDYEWVDWHSTKETRFNHKDNNANLAQRIDRDWRDTSNVGFGLEFWVKPTVALRSGFLVYEAVIPSNKLESSLPDTGRWALTFGPGFRFGNFSLDLNYQAVFFDDQSIDTTQGSAIANLDGDYDGFISVGSLGAAYKW